MADMDKERTDGSSRMMDAPSVPDGYQRHTRRSGFTEPWEPIFAKTTDTAVLLGLRAGPAHANSRGIVHGALITALADNAMGLSCARQIDGQARLLTVSLSVDFLASAKLGEWVEVDTTFVKTGKRLCFAQAFVTADGAPCARVSASFMIAPLKSSP